MRTSELLGWGQLKYILFQGRIQAVKRTSGFVTAVTDLGSIPAEFVACQKPPEPVNLCFSGSGA